MNNDPEQCSIFLAYRGNMIYEDTVPMMETECKAASAAIGRIQAKFDEKKLKEESDKLELKHNKHRKRRIEIDDEKKP